MTAFREIRSHADRRRRRGGHTWPRCERTGKQRFGERKDAKLALEAAHHTRAHALLDGVQSRWTVRRTYRCDYCRGWHLTSRPGWPDA